MAPPAEKSDDAGSDWVWMVAIALVVRLHVGTLLPLAAGSHQRLRVETANEKKPDCYCVGETFRYTLSSETFSLVRVSCRHREVRHARIGFSQPTAVELEILRILWDPRPQSGARDSRRLAAAKGTNYSTTVKMLR